jgi:hypothetical protein
MMGLEYGGFRQYARKAWIDGRFCLVLLAGQSWGVPA